MVYDKYFYVLRFFTTWVLLLCLMHNVLFDKVNLLLLSWITMFVGLYLSFINPRRFVFHFEGTRYEYTGVEKFIIVDSICHVLVFYLIALFYQTYYSSLRPLSSQTINAFLILFIYVAMNNIKKTYGVGMLELGCVTVVSVILYFLIFH